MGIDKKIEENKKAPKAPHVRKDRLEDVDQKNTDLEPAGLNEIGPNEYDEDRTTEIRMKPQPFKKSKRQEDEESEDF